MKKFLMVGLTGLLLVGCGATSHVATEDVVNSKQKASDCRRKNYKDKESCVSEETIASLGLVCKKVIVTGSRMPNRSCTNAAQRAEKRANAKLSVTDFQRGLKTTTTGETRMHNGF
jgi:hypothetical protein